jgi:hypothetical protein
MIYYFLANPDGGFLAPSAVVKRPAVIDFDEIYLKVSLTPMRKKAGQARGITQKNSEVKLRSLLKLF